MFTVGLLDDVFGLRADVLDDPRTGLPVVVPVSAPAPSPTTIAQMYSAGPTQAAASGGTVEGSPSAAAASCGTYRSSTYGMLSGVTKLCAT